MPTSETVFHSFLILGPTLTSDPHSQVEGRVPERARRFPAGLLVVWV
jgi:hypothetical protein